MRLVWGHKDVVAPTVQKIIGLPRGWGNCQTAAVVDSDSRFAAGLVFHNYDPEAGVIEVSAGALNPKWAQRQVLRDAFAYVFDVAQLAVARTAEDNMRVRRLWRAFGADEYIIPRLRGRDSAECILTLTDDSWHNSRFVR